MLILVIITVGLWMTVEASGRLVCVSSYCYYTWNNNITSKTK